MSLCIHECIECNKTNTRIKKFKPQRYKHFQKCFVFQLPNISGYKRTFKSTIKTKLIRSCDSRRFWSLCSNSTCETKQCSKRCQYPITSLDYQIWTFHIFSYRSWFRIHLNNGNQAFTKNSLPTMDRWFGREPKQKPWNPSQTFST